MISTLNRISLHWPVSFLIIFHAHLCFSTVEPEFHEPRMLVTSLVTHFCFKKKMQDLRELTSHN